MQIYIKSGINHINCSGAANNGYGIVSISI